MDYRERAPAPALARSVRALWMLSSGGVGAPAEAGTILPDGCVEIVLSYGDAVTLPGDDRELRRFVVGPTDRAYRLSYRGTVDLIGVRLAPAAAAGFLGPPRAIAGRIVHLIDVDPDLDVALRNCHGAGDRLSAVECAIEARRESALPPDELTEEAIAIIERHRGSIRIDQLSLELGTSRRQFERRFLQATGLPPKRWCRLLRFQAALERLSHAESGTLAAVAHDLGYADQAHFTRDFAGFTGVPPSEAWWMHR
jgi:AraC-like DNA-binding protein